MISRRSLVRVAALCTTLIAAACSGDSKKEAGPTDPGSGTGTLVTSGVPVPNISGAEDSEKLYRIVVPSGASSLSVQTSGGSGDVDVFVRAGTRPDGVSDNCSSIDDGTIESCVVTSPAAGNWYVLLFGFTAYSGVTLTATAGAGGSTTEGQVVPRPAGATSPSSFVSTGAR